MNGPKYLEDIVQGAYTPCIECSVQSYVLVILTQYHMCNGGIQMIALHSHTDLE